MPQSQHTQTPTPGPDSQDPSSGTGPKTPSGGSPERPSYSPVTPTSEEPNLPVPPSLALQHSPAPVVKPDPDFIDTPEAPPVNLDENADAIALRAALSALQFQRQQSLKDIKDLERIKNATIDDPNGFLEHLKASQTDSGIRKGVEVELNSDSDDEESGERQEGNSADEKEPKFPKFPLAQNVIRAPPIEWSKYGVVGEPFEKMHETQRRQPGGTFTGLLPQRTHQVAAPYNPFGDRINQTKK